MTTPPAPTHLSVVLASDVAMISSTASAFETGRRKQDLVVEAIRQVYGYQDEATAP